MNDRDDAGQSTPSVAVPVKVTRSVKQSLEEGFALMYSKKPRCSIGKSPCNITPIYILDLVHPSLRDLVEVQRKRPQNHLRNKFKREDKSGDEGVQEKEGKDVVPDNFDESIGICTKRIMNFIQRKVIRGRVVTGFGGAEMGELLSILHAQGWTDLFLQGTTRRKMGKDETRQFYINVTVSLSSISSIVRGKRITLTPDDITQILGIPNTGWCHYVKRNWPPLDGLPSALDIVQKFSHDPTVEECSIIDKWPMLLLHKLLFDVVHKIILPRGQKCTEENYLDLTLIELLISRQPINLPKLMLCHMGCICVEDNKLHSLGYRFWLADVPALGRGANAPLQRLRAQLALKDEEIAALRASHSAAMDQLHISYGLEHASLVEENSNLKDELAKAATAFQNEKSTNTANLKDLFDLFKTTPPVVSPVITPSQHFKDNSAISSFVCFGILVAD
ncbi:hypothetical protein KY290_008421 [Solanum tuberosum]|uniref:Uncharacterized protein n=1 Tax=Solanum tuberosum TaxID=4113 RepID=A0ABQ7W8G3_SOLTU|nr:hypothetical protein KY289_008830 [Solanum tuberosum]KAH0777010.1 hypothetical protein KY290_008421 [Solanum tuberosum]